MEATPNGRGTLQAYNADIHAGLEKSEIESSNDGLLVRPPDSTGIDFKPSNSAPGFRLAPDGKKMVELDTTQNVYRPKMCYGLRAKPLRILLIALLLATAAVAVGLGVGVSRHYANSASSAAPASTIRMNSSTTSPQAASTDPAATPATVTITSPASPSSTTVENGGCNNGTTFTAADPNNTTFREYCDTDLNVGKTFFTTAIDLGSNKTHKNDFEECMQNCAFYRSQHTVSGVSGTCRSVTWVSDSLDCYLKNATILIDRSDKTAAAVLTVPRNAIGLHSAEVIEA